METADLAALRLALAPGWLASKPALLFPLGMRNCVMQYEAVGGGTRFWLLRDAAVKECDRYGWAELLKADTPRHLLVSQQSRAFK